MTGRPAGPRDCTGERCHAHVLMCPMQAADIASIVVQAGMIRREEGMGVTWWLLGLRELRVADAEDAVISLVSEGIGDRSWITPRDVIMRARSIRRARQDRAPDPIPPAGLEDDERLPLEARADLDRRRRQFVRWYWTAVGNGEPPDRALDLAAGTVGIDRWLPPAPVDEDGPVDPVMLSRVRGLIGTRKAGES